MRFLDTHTSHLFSKLQSSASRKLGGVSPKTAPPHAPSRNAATLPHLSQQSHPQPAPPPHPVSRICYLPQIGSSGPAIFSDDLACDIRSEFRELIGEGLTPQQATDKLISDYTQSGTPTDPDEGPVFWLALAATQWKCGRLLDSVKEKALASIEPDLERWRTSARGNPAAVAKLIAQRKAALDKFKIQLLSEQPKAKKIPKTYHDRTDWEIGHLVSYRLLSGRLIVLRVLGIDERQKGRTALCDIAHWIGHEPPPANELMAMPRWRDKWFNSAVPFWLEHNGKMALYSLKPADFPRERLHVIATGQPFAGIDIAGCSYFGGWSAFDQFLQSHFEVT